MQGLMKAILDRVMVGAAMPADRPVVEAHLNPGKSVYSAGFRFRREPSESSVKVYAYVMFSGQGEWEQCATYTVLAGGQTVKGASA